MKTVKVERKGSYQGVLQWGITGSSEITPSKATAEKWARLENAARKQRGSASTVAAMFLVALFVVFAIAAMPLIHSLEVK